jgi:hypothetical protein
MALALALFLSAQDGTELQVLEFLRQFQEAAETEQALNLLSSRLSSLGQAASLVVARKLAEDLRDGMASAAVPAFIDALSGRPGALEPLQRAFRDPATSSPGRLELASALLELDDTTTWREGIGAIAADAGAPLEQRLRASGDLLEVMDPRGLDELRGILAGMAARPPEERLRVFEFLSRIGSPETESLLAALEDDPRFGGQVRAARAGPTAGDAPREELIDEPRRAAPSGRAASRKKTETGGGRSLMMRDVALGAAAVGIFALLLGLRRKA